MLNICAIHVFFSFSSSISLTPLSSNIRYSIPKQVVERNSAITVKMTCHYLHFLFSFFFLFVIIILLLALSRSFLLRSCPDSFFLFLITTFSPLLPYLVLLISRFYYPPLLIPFTIFLSLASYPFHSFLRSFLITHNRSHCLCPFSLPSPPVIRD